MWDYSQLPLLKPREFVVAALGGPEDNGEATYLPLRVAKTRVFDFSYNWVEDYSGFLPLGPVGSSGIPGTAQSFFLSHLQPQLTEVANVQNFLTLTTNNEVLQLFLGIAPSWLRVYPEQPPNSPSTTMDQNINITSSFYDAGYLDGYRSPFLSPTEAGELLVLAGLEPTFTLANPVSVLASPKFRLIINRMTVQPITDTAFAKAVASGQVAHTRFVSVGLPTASVSAQLNISKYPGATTVRIPSHVSPSTPGKP